MLKIEQILALYSKDLKMVKKFDGEEFGSWYIDGMSKIEVETQFTKEEIEAIYFSGL